MSRNESWLLILNNVPSILYSLNMLVNSRISSYLILIHLTNQILLSQRKRRTGLALLDQNRNNINLLRGLKIRQNILRNLLEFLVNFKIIFLNNSETFCREVFILKFHRNFLLFCDSVFGTVGNESPWNEVKYFKLNAIKISFKVFNRMNWRMRLVIFCSGSRLRKLKALQIILILSIIFEVVQNALEIKIIRIGIGFSSWVRNVTLLIKLLSNLHHFMSWYFKLFNNLLLHINGS